MGKSIQMPKLVQMEQLNRDLGTLIGRAIDEAGGGFGFCLFMFGWNDEPEWTWISNAQRPEMVKALKEFIARVEAGTEDELGKTKRWNATEN